METVQGSPLDQRRPTRTIQQDAIAEWHRINDALAAKLTRDFDRKQKRRLSRQKKTHE